MFKNKIFIRSLVLIGLAFVGAAAHAMGIIDLTAGHGAAALGLMAMGGEMDIKDLQKALDKVGDQVKAEAERVMAEAGKMTTAQKERVDELLLKQGETQEQLKSAMEQIKALEQKSVRAPGADDQGYLKSAGFQVIEAKGFEDKITAFKNNEVKQASFGVKAVTGASAPNAVVPQRLPTPLLNPQIRLTIRDLLMRGRTISQAITYMKQTGFTNNAAPVAEGTRKPESTLTLAQVTTTVIKLAHFMKASSEILNDYPQMQSIIDGQLSYGLKLIEEGQLLKGSGVGNNLNGIYTQATAYATPSGAIAPAATIAGNIDKLRLALLQAEIALFPSDGLVMNPVDWANIQLAKTTYGEYLIGDPQSTVAPTLWGRPVVTSFSMTVNTFLAGAFGMGAQIFDREDAAVVIATENEDDFVSNLVTVLIEERLALATYRPEAFIKGTLANTVS